MLQFYDICSKWSTNSKNSCTICVICAPNTKWSMAYKRALCSKKRSSLQEVLQQKDECVSSRNDIFILENHTRIEKRNKKTKEENEDGQIVYVLQHFEMTKCTSTVRTNKCSSLFTFIYKPHKCCVIKSFKRILQHEIHVQTDDHRKCGKINMVCLA